MIEVYPWRTDFWKTGFKVVKCDKHVKTQWLELHMDKESYRNLDYVNMSENTYIVKC